LDRRYDDNGRLIEKNYYFNNGILSHRNTYEYAGNKRIERSLGTDGSEWSRTDVTLDSVGNIVKQEMYGAEGKVDITYSMTYELDKYGNWIIQRTYEVTQVRKRPWKKLIWTSYRTITYFPD
jgi:hypothetical protein